MSIHASCEPLNKAELIRIDLPTKANSRMCDIIASASKQFKAHLKNYPSKRNGSNRSISTGRIDFRPGGEVNYFVTYGPRTGYSE